MTRKELNEVRDELAQNIRLFADEYQKRRQRVIRLRSRVGIMMKRKCLEHAEAYQEQLESELPPTKMLLCELTKMQALMTRLNEQAA